MSEKLSLRTNANGDIYVYIEDSAGASLAFGADSANGVVALNTLGMPNVEPLQSTANLTIDPTANGDILFRPHGTGKSEFKTGNVQITEKNLLLPHTTNDGADGCIYTYQPFFGTHVRYISFPDDFNVYIGSQVGTFPNPTSCSYNIAIGAEFTFDSVTALGANNNIAMGRQVLDDLTTGDNNIALGSVAIRQLISGSENIGIGTAALNNIETGSGNTALGAGAGSDLEGASSFNIMIGNPGTAGVESNTIRIGENGTHTTAFIAGIDGVNVGSVAKVVTMASDQLGTATITAGTGITVTPTANTITIAGVGGGVTWTVITINQTAVINNGYFCNKAGTLALALPAASAVGDVIEVININTTTGTQFTQSAGQQIFFAGSSTTLGVGGTLTSTQVGDTIKLICRTANLTWFASSIVGNWTNV